MKSSLKYFLILTLIGSTVIKSFAFDTEKVTQLSKEFTKYSSDKIEALSKNLKSIRLPQYSIKNLPTQLEKIMHLKKLASLIQNLKTGNKLILAGGVLTLANIALAAVIYKHAKSTIEKNKIKAKKELHRALLDLEIYGSTALICAIQNNDIELVRELINNGADVNKADENWFTPLMYATHKSNHEIIKLLLEAGADNAIVETSYWL